MSSVRPRLSIDAALWEAVLAVSRARRIDPSDYVSECIRMSQNALPIIERATELTAEHMANSHEIGDQIRYIHDVLVSGMSANELDTQD